MICHLNFVNLDMTYMYMFDLTRYQYNTSSLPNDDCVLFKITLCSMGK